MTAARRWFAAIGLLTCAHGWAADSSAPKAALMTPPPDARHFVIESTGGKHGDSWLWILPDGSHAGRETGNLRGEAWDVDYVAKPGGDGLPAQVVIRGFNSSGDAGETFSVTTGTARWKSPIDHGSSPYGHPAYYASQGGPVADLAWLTDLLTAAPDHTLKLLPGGESRAEKLTSLTLRAAGTGTPASVDLWAVSGFWTSPTLVWTDPQGKFFGQAGFLSWLPEAYAAEMPRLIKAQDDAMAVRTARLATSLVKAPAGPVAFVHTRLFDAERLRFLADQTVVVQGGKITAVGNARSVPLPAGAQIIDGHGRTLVPGLWDCHLHVGDDYTGLQELSMGVTSVRDPGNIDAKTIDRRERAARGELLFPHVYPSSMIDGKGPYTAQVANVATSQAEAIALVDRAHANHFTAVKFYGTFNPNWLPAAIAEAHRLGLHVHGHIPAGIRPMDAINDGYDEVTHINWVIMQAMPDSVIKISNSAARFEGPGRYAKDVDLDGPAIRLIVNTMAARHIYSDPTMSAFETLYVAENGDLAASYAPFVGTLPPAGERGFRSGGLAVPKDLTRADYRASWAKMVALLKKMHDARIPVVAGTDGAGIELIRELEIYREAGFSAAEALAAATLVPARLVGVEKTTGSIRVGKSADLSLVEGDPATHIGDLRHTRVVMLEGKLLDPDALRTAAGFSGRPK